MDTNLRPQVLVGLMSWNQRGATLRCLDSLRQVKFPKLKVVLVDNGSRDGLSDNVRAHYPEVTLIVNASNRGCAGGRNDILNFFLSTDIEYGMFLDNDAVVLDDCFETLIREINRAPDIGVVGPKVYFMDKPTFFWSRGGAQFNPWKGGFERSGNREEDRGQYEPFEEVDTVSGGFTFFKRAVALSVPQITESYFMYYEDSDWCFKVRQAGFKLIASKNARILHESSSAFGMGSPLFYYFRTRNLLLFMARNASWYFPLFLLRYLCWILPNTLLSMGWSEKKNQGRAVLFGLWDFLWGKFFDCPHASLFSKPEVTKPGAWISMRKAEENEAGIGIQG